MSKYILVIWIQLFGQAKKIRNLFNRAVLSTGDCDPLILSRGRLSIPII